MSVPSLRLLVPAALAAAILAGAAGCGRDRDGTPAATASGEAMAVSTGVVTVTPVETVITAGGALAAPETAVVSSRVLAPVREVLVRAGDRVRRGQPLIRLASDDLSAQAASAQAMLDAARSGTAAADADVRAADAALSLARVTHDRIAALFADRSATAQERDEAVAALRAAEARAQAAVSTADAARRRVDAAAASGRAADVAASWTTLAAGFDGHVAIRHVDPGSTAVPGAPLLTLESDGPLEMHVRLDSRRAAAIVRDQPVRVEIDTAAGSARRTGRVTEIARVDPQTHQFAVTVAIDGADPSWRPGLFGRASFAVGTEDRLTVPASAVVARGQMQFVYMVGPDGLARLRAVSAGEAAGDRRVVLSGLSAGDRVVIDPPAGLTDGARVTPSAPVTGGGRS